jgi:adenosylcobinamide-GDP ribazoletransferase
MAFFPLVGMLMGVLLVLLRRLFYYLPVSSLVGDTLVLIFWIWLSGGLHLDGFADSVDGFLGGHNKEEILKIMKDSSIGAKGVVALVSLLLLKFVLLVEMPLFLKDAALFFTPTIGRWSMVIAAFLGKPARLKNSMGKLFMDYVSWREVIFASLTMAVIGILLFRLYFLPLVMVGIGLVLLILKYSQKRIGGISGDILGAINEIVEVLCLLVIYLLN